MRCQSCDCDSARGGSSCSPVPALLFPGITSPASRSSMAWACCDHRRGSGSGRRPSPLLHGPAGGRPSQALSSCPSGEKAVRSRGAG